MFVQFANSKNCGENIHCNQYMDFVESALKRCGFETKRNPRNRTGDGIYRAVEDANIWGADLYYVSHSNAFNGNQTYSLLMPSTANVSMEYAEIIAAERKKIYPYEVKIKVNGELIETRLPDMPVVYDELTFHDNPVTAKWLHENLETLAENTVKGICKIFSYRYVPKKAEIKPDNGTNRRISCQS